MLPRVMVDYRPNPMSLDEYSSLHGFKKRTQGSAGVELDQSLFSAKKERSKVFTGRRNVGTKEVPTLFDSCIRVLCDNLDGLGYTGGVPYEILKPLLERATAEQLFRIEDFNPYLAEETDSLWESLAKRDFKGAVREELESWREVYERLLEERERKLQKVKHTIGAHISSENKTRKAILAVVKTPREVKRKQEKFGTGRGPIATTEQVLQHRRDMTDKLCRRPAARAEGSKIGGGPAASSSSEHAASYANNSSCKQRGAAYYGSSSDGSSRKRKAPVAPLMAKTLKMLKRARR